MIEHQKCDVLRHLEWTLSYDWMQPWIGRPGNPDWATRATSWRKGRKGTAAWAETLGDPGSLSWRGLQEAQSAAGLDPRFRSGPAFCGARRYGWYDGLEERFARKMDVDGSERDRPVVRAVRGYLDIIHVHPFADGNTRAACTWLAWSLSIEGQDVPDLGEVIDLPKPPGHDAPARLMMAALSR